MNPIRILCIGDVVGQAAVAALEKHLWPIRNTLGADLVITNSENAAQGNGLDVQSAKRILFAGTDVITSGNHIWKKKEIGNYLNDTANVIRPANFPASCPGCGYTICEARGYRVLVMNVLGTMYMEALDSPFDAIDRILALKEGSYDISVLDIHAEATSEKAALAAYFDGRVSAIFGTHTHVQTADASVLPGGTGFITDVGMTGPVDSILGVKKEIVIEKFRKHMPVRFDIADNEIALCGCLFTYDTDTKRVTQATPVRYEFTQ